MCRSSPNATPMKMQSKTDAVLFRPTLRARVDWMAHWILSRSELMRRRLADPDQLSVPSTPISTVSDTRPR